MKRAQVWQTVKRGGWAMVRCGWRWTRLTAAWIWRKVTIAWVNRRIRGIQDERDELLMQIGRIVLARRVASSLQDEELASLCQGADELETEIKGLKQLLEEVVAAPLLREDLAAGPLGSERPASASD